MEVRVNGESYLLNVPGHRYFLHTIVDEKQWAIEDELDEEIHEQELKELYKEVEKAHNAISAQDYKVLDDVYFMGFEIILSFEIVE